MMLFILALTGPLLASEPAYSMWNGQESVDEYAKKVNLSPTQTLDLGNGVKMDLVLIPAGKFLMGTPDPMPVDEDAFHTKIVISQALLAASVGTLLVMLAVVLIQAIRQQQRPKLSLARLLAITASAGVAVLSSMHWQESGRAVEKAKLEYATAKARVQKANSDEKPAHPVTLKKPFYMGKFAVTQEQYHAVIGTNPSHFKGKDNPVEMVSWDDAQRFCKKLMKQMKQSVRLPTEAEWEYACRAGTTTTWHSGDTKADLGRVAWYGENSSGKTHPVGQREPNVFRLYDMHGNVWQWCQDWYEENYYRKSEAENPQGPAQGNLRLLRGGSWNIPRGCATRDWSIPVLQSNGGGFRVVVPAVAVPDR